MTAAKSPAPLPSAPDRVDGVAVFLRALGGREDWRRDAACRGMGSELFFPERGEPTSVARAVCARCPVRAQCLEYATTPVVSADRERVAAAEGFGIWGGTSARDRRRGIVPDLDPAAPRPSILAERARVMVRRGYSTREIAARLHVAPRQVFDLTGGGLRSRARRRTELEARAVEMARTGMRVPDIAAELGLSERHTYDVARSAIEARADARRSRDARIVELAQAGARVSSIAAELEVSVGRVYKILRDRLPDRRHSPNRPAAGPLDLERRARELDEARMPIHQIAAELGVDKARVFEILEAELVA